MLSGGTEGLAQLLAAVAAGSIAGGARRALSDGSGACWSYGVLVAEANAVCRSLRAHRADGVLVVRTAQDVRSVAALLGGLAAGYQVVLVGAGAEVDDLFETDAIVEPGGLRLIARDSLRVSTDPALLLSTSGTTGSRKFVRLPLAALSANARQIAEALRIGGDDVGLVHLPLHYSYGLSVLTSHLAAGAAAHLTGRSCADRAFWAEASHAGATQLPGVPFHWSLLSRGGIDALVPPSIRIFTQAGGALAAPLRHGVHDAVARRGGRFYIMYGQTEAGPRITILDHDDFPARPDSVGRALAGGALEIVDDHGIGMPTGAQGAIVYRGPNLMSGYARCRADLVASPECLPSVATGDRGTLDAQGFLFVRGRNPSFAKVGGLRIDLDDLAARLAAAGEVALLPGDNHVHVFHEPSDTINEAIRSLAAGLALPIDSFRLNPVDALPRQASGKIDYQQLRALR